MDSFPEFVRTFHSHEDNAEPAGDCWIPNSSLCLLGELLECILSDIIILVPYRILVG